MKKGAGPVAHCAKCGHSHMKTATKCAWCGLNFKTREKVNRMSKAQKSLLLGSVAALFNHS